MAGKTSSPSKTPFHKSAELTFQNSGREELEGKLAKRRSREKNGHYMTVLILPV